MYSTEMAVISLELKELESRYKALQEEAAKNGWTFEMTINAIILSADCNRLSSRVQEIQKELGID